jgi:hypothetical protein
MFALHVQGSSIILAKRIEYSLYQATMGDLIQTNQNYYSKLYYDMQGFFFSENEFLSSDQL